MPEIRGAGGGGKRGGSRPPQEAPNSLRAKATARLIDVLGEGEIVGLVDGARSIFLDDTPLQNPDGSTNFRGVTWIATAGLPDQHPVPGFAAAETEVAVGQRVRADTPVVRTISTTPLDAVRIKLRIPALTKVDTKTGDIRGSSVSIAIDVQPNGGTWLEAVQDSIAGKCTAPYERAYRIQLPQGGAPWQVRLRRLTPDNDSDSTLQNETWWSSLTEILDWTLSYPDTALVALAVDAEAFGQNIPRRTYDVRGLKIPVPSNYDPETRTYTGTWNGTFQTAWTDNPAWIFLDLLTNTRYGLGRDIQADAVDKWALYEIARHCDELVPDGAGGQEPRYSFNGVLNTAAEAWQVLQTIAASFRGMLHWGAGRITATQDRPAEPVKLVSNANVLDGAFAYQGSALSARHTVAQVTWSNPADGFRPAIEWVEDPEGLARWGVRPIEIAALGTTTRGQARRLGRWLLDTEATATETVTYRAALDHADLRPGDVIAVADRWVAGLRLGGRVAAATADSVALDAPVLLDASATHTIRVTLPSGELAERAVISPPGSHSILAITPPFATPPEPNAIWLLASSSAAPRLFRVISVTEVEEAVFEVTALAHDPTKYARIEQGLNIDSPAFAALPSGPLPPPTGIAVREFLVVTGGAARPALTLSWEHTADPRVRTTQAEIRLPGEAAWRAAGETTTNSLDVLDTRAGVAAVRIRARDAFGRASVWAEREVTLLGLSAPPGDVTGLRGTVRNDSLRLTWQPVPEDGFATYRVRFSPALTDVTWSSAVDVAERVVGPAVELPLMLGTYLLRAETPAGVLSPGTALFVNHATPIAPFNVIAVLPQAPGWAGTRDGVSASEGVLSLAAWETLGTYQFASPDLGEAYVSRVSARLAVAGFRSADDIFAWPDLFAIPDIFGAASSEWAAALDLRTTLDDPAASPAWSPWQPFLVADYAARAFEFRLTLSSLDGGETGPQVADLTVEIDMPDRIEGQDAVVVPADGLSIAFPIPFAATPAISVSGRDLASGDTADITAQSRSGFHLRFRDSSGTGVARTADWIAKGYGRRT